MKITPVFKWYFYMFSYHTQTNILYYVLLYCFTPSFTYMGKVTKIANLAEMPLYVHLL